MLKPYNRITSLLILILMLSGGHGLAAEGSGPDGVLKDGTGPRLYPLHSLTEVRITGGLTGIVQGRFQEVEGRRAEASLSGDLLMEFPVPGTGSLLLRLDMARGAGLTSLPDLFANSRGNPTGPNSDIEEVDLQLVEARVEFPILQNSVRVIFGQVDPTAFFDENELANSETTQFMAQGLVNNPAIEWGGDENAFGPGIILLTSPNETMDLALGLFEGDGNYEGILHDPFVIGQASWKTRWHGRDGNLRIYAWGRFTPHCDGSEIGGVLIGCDGGDTAIRNRNTGIGMSLDHRLSESVGIWSRWGIQDAEVSRFDRAISLGVTRSGLPGRELDTWGLGYGLAFPSEPYETLAGRSFKAEQYAEFYYRYILSGDGEETGIQISPDLQVIVHPGGDGSADTVVIWGLRTQVGF